jgi:hypothetical protein
MTFNKLEGGNQNAFSDAPKSESLPDYEKRREEQRTQEALTYLVETGRARTLEDAEQYLESLNRIKEKLLLFAREQLLEEIHSDYTPAGWGIEYTACGNSPNLDNLVVSRIDRTDPQLWHLTRVVEPAYYSCLPDDLAMNAQKGNIGSYREQLRVGIDHNEGELIIQEGISHQWPQKLQQYLTEAERDLLRKEFSFAMRDLERQLRILADYISRHDNESKDWQSLLGEMPPRK